MKTKNVTVYLQDIANWLVSEYDFPYDTEVVSIEQYVGLNSVCIRVMSEKFKPLNTDSIPYHAEDFMKQAKKDGIISVEYLEK
ncbi:hypothetical protein H8E77_02015 [bacterium]|nr:hypothetical protein [bacterium]